jgi:hypothetical protein
VTERGDEPKKIGDIVHGLVLSRIASAPDDATRKRYVMLAREHGAITAEEAEDWLKIMELRAA